MFLILFAIKSAPNSLNIILLLVLFPEQRKIIVFFNKNNYK